MVSFLANDKNATTIHCIYYTLFIIRCISPEFLLEFLVSGGFYCLVSCENIFLSV